LGLVISLPICLIVTGVTWFFLPKMYSAIAILRFAPSDTMLIFETADQSKWTQQSPGFDLFKRSQRQWMKSRLVLNNALRDLSLSKIPILESEPDVNLWIDEHFSVSFPEDSEVALVSISAERPEGLHLLVNAIIDAYFKEIVDNEQSKKLLRVNSLELACKKADGELRTKRTELKSLQEKVTTVDATALSLAQANSLRELGLLQGQHAKVRFELLELQGELELLEKAAEAGEAKHTVTEHELMIALQSDAAAVQIRSDKQKSQDAIEKHRAAVKNGSSRIDEMTRQLQKYDDRLEARKEVLRDELLQKKSYTGVAEREDLLRRIDLLTVQEARLSKLVKGAEEEAKKFGRSSIDAEMLLGEIRTVEAVRQRLAEELERTKIEAQAPKETQTTRVRLMQRAYPARLEKSKSKIAKIAAAGFAGFLLPFGLVVFLDARKRRINSGKDVESGLGLSLIGAVPLIPARVMKRLDGPSPREQYWRSLLSESVDSIAAVLLHAAQSCDNRVVMVSSANAGEGKTTLAAHLATSLALAGRRTALVDFDLRRPSLHAILGLNLKPGVIDLLRKQTEFEAALQATQIRNMVFLSAGRGSSAGLSGLGAADLDELFNKFRSNFEFIVVDSSPILPVVDTRLIAQNCDSVVLSVRRDVSCSPNVKAACQMLDVFGVPILGAVMTGGSGEGHYHQRYGNDPVEDSEIEGAAPAGVAESATG